MSIGFVYSKASSYFIKPDRDLDHLISTYNESEITNLLGLPTEVWNEILTQLPWIDLKRAEGTCKQMLILSQAIFKARRQQWASACPEVSEWPMRHLIIQVTIQPLFFRQSVFVSVVRIMGLERFRNLPELKDASLETGVQIRPQQMTAPLMKGTAGRIQFLAIRYQLINIGQDEHAGRRLVMALIHISPYSIIKPNHVCYGGDTPFTHLTLLDDTGHFFRTSLLPKLLLQGVLDLSPTEVTLYTRMRDLRQIKLV